ncbi:MAG: FHA domain-containing protein [Planctomycetes bacterium]|nr:FHA domain-containing protein [Planctomycetota bacterium]
MLVAYEDFVRARSGLERADFLAEVTDPHLFIPSLNPVGAPEEPTSFATMRFAPGAARPAPREGAMIIPVRKRRDSNAFAMMITLGRAPNNDLVIPDQRVSKFHAYFRKLGQQWTINDANSMNGTWVGAQRISSDRSAALQSGASIRLAETLEMIFLLPEELYERLQAG